MSFCVDAALCATIMSVRWTYLGEMIDIHYFSARSICFKLCADVSPLDVVHLKFSV